MKKLLRKYSKEFYALIFLILIYIAYASSLSPTIQFEFNDVIPSIGDGTEIGIGDTSKKQVIFTFDGGSGDKSTGQILEILNSHHVKGTFFLTGMFVKKNRDIVKKIILHGHEIFNHTEDHPYLTELSDAEIANELISANEKMMLGFEKSTKPYFRAPFGNRDARVRNIARSIGYRSVSWTVDADDWRESEGITDDEVKNRILNNIRPGVIYLMHLGDNISGRILDDVFTKIESRGYKIVSLTEGI